jgi:hypothetical protein
MPMMTSQTSSLTEFSKSRVATEPSTKQSLHSALRNLITTARMWLGKLSSSAVARVLMIFFIGFGAGVAWQSYGNAGRKVIAGWSPHLAWLAPAATPDSAAAERFKAMSLALATARQSLDKLSTEISKAQDGDVPPRKGQEGDARRRRAAR